jgi:hypothetical protein
MSLPILSAASPTSIPAKVYDRIWIEDITIKGADPNGEISGAVKLRKYGMFDGVAELDPNYEKWITIPNMLEVSATDTDLAAAMGSLIAYVNKLGQENDIISS